MKKLLACLLALAMLFGMAACSEKPADEPSAPSQNESNEPAATPDGSGDAPAESTGWVPESTVNIILPSSAGGSTDLIARIWAKYAEQIWGQSVIVTNVTGANGAIGDGQVKDAAADGYTVCFHHQAIITNELAGLMDFSYDAFKMGPNFADDPSFCIFTNSDAYPDLDSLVEAAKANPGALKMGVAVGGYSYLMAACFMDSAGIELTAVDLGDSTENTAGLLGGHIDAMPSLYGTNAAYVDSGDFAVLGVATDERISLYPDVPTFKESGLDFSFPGYQFGFLFPKDTSDEIVDAYCAVTEQILANEDAVAELAGIGAIPAYRNSADNLAFWDEMDVLINEYWVD